LSEYVCFVIFSVCECVFLGFGDSFTAGAITNTLWQTMGAGERKSNPQGLEVKNSSIIPLTIKLYTPKKSMLDWLLLPTHRKTIPCIHCNMKCLILHNHIIELSRLVAGKYLSAPWDWQNHWMVEKEEHF